MSARSGILSSSGTGQIPWAEVEQMRAFYLGWAISQTASAKLINEVLEALQSQSPLSTCQQRRLRGLDTRGRNRLLMAVETRWYLAMVAFLVTMGVRGLMV